MEKLLFRYLTNHFFKTYLPINFLNIYYHCSFLSTVQLERDRKRISCSTKICGTIYYGERERRGASCPKRQSSWHSSTTNNLAEGTRLKCQKTRKLFFLPLTFGLFLTLTLLLIFIIIFFKKKRRKINKKKIILFFSWLAGWCANRTQPRCVNYD